MRRRFLRRAIAFMVVLVVVLVAVGALAASLGAHRPVAAAAAVGLLVVIVVLAFRTARRTAAPIADVMEAADRVADGDYAARVTPAGPGATRRLGRAFNQMAERLEVQERQRRALFAEVAHELRTPLAVLRGNLEGIVDGLYPADRGHLGPLLDQTDAMARLLDDLQTLAMAEAGALALHREPTDVGALVRDAVTAFTIHAGAAGVTLAVNLDDGLPADADLDPVRMGEVLRNLLSNAIRHTPAGGSVRVSAGIADDHLRLVVADTGPGIQEGELDAVFERFVRSDAGGHGLGLAIARALVDAHGGAIAAENTPGAGAAFVVTVPTRSVSASPS